MFKVATWNVNSIQTRLERVLDFLQREAPDALCLQELKCEENKFPQEAISAAGYHASVYGQKAYNGVAVLTKNKPSNVIQGLQDGVSDAEARLISVTVSSSTLNKIRILSAYVPNGQEVGSDKYDYKLKWFKRLRSFLDKNHNPKEKILLAGDFNVAPEDRDCWNPKAWKGRILFSEPEKKALSHVIAFGLTDTTRIHHEGELFSWWNYRQSAFENNHGLRIDFIFATPPLAKLCTWSRIDRNERRGPQPSDHVPVITEFEC